MFVVLLILLNLQIHFSACAGDQISETKGFMIKISNTANMVK